MVSVFVLLRDAPVFSLSFIIVFVVYISFSTISTVSSAYRECLILYPSIE